MTGQSSSLPSWRRRVRRWLLVALIPTAYLWFATISCLLVYVDRNDRCFSLGRSYVEFDFVWDCVRSAIIGNAPCPRRGPNFYVNCNPFISAPGGIAIRFSMIMGTLIALALAVTYWEAIRRIAIDVIWVLTWGLFSVIVGFIAAGLTPVVYPPGGQNMTVGIAVTLITSVIPLVYRYVTKAPVYPQGHCQSCGYNLTGNVSGICSECGAPINKGGSARIRAYERA